MIAGTYITSGLMLAITAWLFDQGVLTAGTQTIAWMVIFFVASAGASSAYLTVSEIFPMETRALAIAFFYAVGTGLGGIIGPVLFGNLIATKKPGPVAVGYLIGAGLMAGAGVVAAFLAVDAEQRSLEDIAAPLSEGAGDQGDGAEGEGAARNGAAANGAAANGAAANRDGHDGRRDDIAGPGHALPRQTGPYPLPRQRGARTSWAPMPQASVYPRTNPYLAREVDALVVSLRDHGPASSIDLSRAIRPVAK